MMLLWKNSGKIYLKYVAFFLFVTLAVIEATDQHTEDYFCFVVVFTGAILSFQSQPGRTTAGAQSTTTQAAGHSQSEIVHTPTAVVHTSWKLFVFELLLTSAVSLQQSAAERFIGLPVPVFSNWNILQKPLKYNWRLVFQSVGA